MRAEWSMSEEELRGAILEKIWTHRRKTIMFDRALKDLSILFEVKKSILKQLERGGLIRYTFEPDTGLGSGDMTFKGFEVAEGPLSIQASPHPSSQLGLSVFDRLQPSSSQHR